MWEYKIVDVPFERKLMHFNQPKSPEKTGEAQMLDEMGAQGWELVSIATPSGLGTATFSRMYFKRQRSSAQAS